MVTILITGGNGQLGSEFRAVAPEFRHLSFIFTDIEELDLTDRDKVMSFFDQNRPDVVINCAAYTAVDKAEDEPEKAMWINRDAVANLAGACDVFDCFLVHISTDFVFNGCANRPYTEEDIPSPLSVYGLSKLDGEEALLSCLQRGLIIRTSWLYSPYGNNFMKTILDRCKSIGNLNIVDDQVGTPTYARDLANAILQLLPAAMAATQPDILHFSNGGQCSWYEFAVEIARQSGSDCTIKPIKTGEYPAKAIRPAYSVMDLSKIKSKYGIQIKDWKESLGECLKVIDKR